MSFNFKPPKPLAPGLHPGIGLDQLKAVQCECGGNTFIRCLQAYLASPLQTLNGNQLIVQVPSGLICTNCGKRNLISHSTKPVEKEDSQNVNN